MQADLFSAPQAIDWTPRPDDVRRDMVSMLDELRSASAMPWTDRQLFHRRTIFPQMACWLDNEDAAQLVELFGAELARLSRA